MSDTDAAFVPIFQANSSLPNVIEDLTTIKVVKMSCQRRFHNAILTYLFTQILDYQRRWPSVANLLKM